MPTFLNRDTVGVLSRILVASIGGYLFSMIGCMWLAETMEFASTRDARIFNNMMFFLFYTLVVIWAFTPRSHFSAVAGICGSTIFLWVFWLLVGGVAA